MKQLGYIFSTLVITILWLPTAMAGCWSVKDRVDMAMAELDSTTTFSIRDAVTCEPVANATMTIGADKLTTDSRGEIKVTALTEIMDANIGYSLSKPGYMTVHEKFKIEAGVVHPTRLLMSKAISASAIRFVLSWSDTPVDLDLHLVGSDFHVSYRDMRNYKNLVTLDSDAEEGYGAETITVGKKNPHDIYRLYVHKFSGEVAEFIDKHARVAVYVNGRLDRVVSMPDTTKPVVEVLQIRHGSIKYINQAKSSI